MEAFLLCSGIVALAEMGDKTQLLSLMLAARYQKPLPIIAGILVATLLNHALAGGLGAWLTSWSGPAAMRWIVGISFILMGGWMLVPDTLEDDVSVKGGLGVFAATVMAFFLAEMGDKTQVATVALAARFESLAAVVLGTTAGMLIANVPAVLMGDRFAKRIPMRAVHGFGAALFVALGIYTLVAGLPT